MKKELKSFWTVLGSLKNSIVFYSCQNKRDVFFIITFIKLHTNTYGTPALQGKVHLLQGCCHVAVFHLGWPDLSCPLLIKFSR